MIRASASGIQLVTVAAVLALAGCATPVTSPPSQTIAPAPPQLGPRPATLSLTGVDPCSLLTPQQADSLKIGTQSPGQDPTLGAAAPQCALLTEMTKPTNSWLIRLGLKEPAAMSLHATDPLVKAAQIAGFPAVETHSIGSDGHDDCIYAIDIAANQNLSVGYSNDYDDYPGMNHRLACQLAGKVAEMVVANLRARSGH